MPLAVTWPFDSSDFPKGAFQKLEEFCVSFLWKVGGNLGLCVYC